MNYDFYKLKGKRYEGTVTIKGWHFVTEGTGLYCCENGREAMVSVRLVFSKRSAAAFLKLLTSDYTDSVLAVAG